MEITSGHYIDSRLAATKVLAAILSGNGSLSTQLSRYQHLVRPEQQAHLKELCFGSCRWFPRLNTVALSMLKSPFKEQDMDLYAALITGLYQIDYMNTPDHASVSETVDLAKKFNKEWAVKLLNGVLRRYLREKEAIHSQLAEIPSFKYSQPKWFLKRLQKYWPDYWESIVEESSAHPPMCLRVNQTSVSRETLMQTLENKQISTVSGKYSNSALYLESPISLSDVEEFGLGYFSVQDEAAQLAATLLSPQANERILDACAAPGGKTGHILEKEPSVNLTAVELEPWRLEKIKENLTRLNLSATLISSDVSQLEAWWDGKLFDKILLDAPCSATGVIRRNPDIKINRKPDDIAELSKIQKNILDSVWQTLKPGGVLLYATCSILPEENTLQISQFLQTHSEATDVKIESDWGVDQEHGKQLFPQRNGHDGFYYCLLKKTS